MKMRICAPTILATLFLIAGQAQAHFPWLAVDENNHVVMFFGETPADRTYKLPESISKAEVFAFAKNAEPKKIALSAKESDDFIGLQSTTPVEAVTSLKSDVTFGIYHGSKLDYSAIHHAGKLPNKLDSQAERTEEDAKIAANLVDTDTGVDVWVQFDNKPLPDTTVTLLGHDGSTHGEVKTDAEGKASFSDSEVTPGLNGVMVGHTVKDKTGEINGTAYKSVSCYLTVTFNDPEDFDKAK